MGQVRLTFGPPVLECSCLLGIQIRKQTVLETKARGACCFKCWWGNEKQSKKSSLSSWSLSLKDYQIPKQRAVCNIMTLLQHIDVQKQLAHAAPRFMMLHCVIKNMTPIAYERPEILQRNQLITVIIWFTHRDEVNPHKFFVLWWTLKFVSTVFVTETESQRVQNGGSCRSLLALLHHLL